MGKRIFVGVAWPYANGPLHVGHLAGAYLPADIFARYHRMKGNHVLMVSGSDCHGTPITLRADQEGVKPGVIVRRYHESFLGTFRKLRVSFDWYTQTYSSHHCGVASEFFSKLQKGGHIDIRTLDAAYSETLKRFLPDRYVTGTCPGCGSDRARGDQCDQCGSVHEPQDLVDPRSTLDDAPIVFRPTEHAVLRLSALDGPIRHWLDSLDLSRWRANTLGLTRAWLERGLEDRAITRDLEWGVPVPIDGFGDKRLYVWFEAVIGYLSASIEWAKESGEADSWRRWWNPARDVEAYYFIGKDNIAFHAIVWPALLLADRGLQLPFDVVANEFLNLEGRKMSSSRGWALTLPEIEDRYDPDALRYYLIANAPESRDANWAWEDFIQRNNNELVAVWGNLVQRTLGLAYGKFGEVPTPGNPAPSDRALLEAGRSAFESVGALIEAARFKQALEQAFALAHQTNLYLSREEPWKILDNRPGRAATVLYAGLQTVSDLGTLLAPFLPESCARVRGMLGAFEPAANVCTEHHVVDGFGERNVLRGPDKPYPTWRRGILEPGTRLSKPQRLFDLLDAGTAQQELERLVPFL